MRRAIVATAGDRAVSRETEREARSEKREARSEKRGPMYIRPVLTQVCGCVQVQHIVLYDFTVSFVRLMAQYSETRPGVATPALACASPVLLPTREEGRLPQRPSLLASRVSRLLFLSLPDPPEHLPERRFLAVHQDAGAIDPSGQPGRAKQRRDAEGK